MTNYTRGDYREKRAKEFLESYGYTCWQSRASHGIADIVCLIAHHEPLLVQVKLGNYVPHEEWNALYQLAANLGARPIVVTCTGNSPHITMRFRQILGYHRKNTSVWPAREVFRDAPE